MLASNIVGLTGGIGSGKSTVTALLAAYGIPVIDTDIVAREVVEPGEPTLNKIANHFGPDILTSLGELNRQKLRELVFDAPEQRRWLEQLLHPIIRERIEQQLQRASSEASYCILSSALLFESQQDMFTGLNVVIDLPKTLQITRSCARDKNSEAQITKIIDSQIDRQLRCKKADIIIDNSGDSDALKHQVNALHQQLMQKFDAKSE